MPRTREESLFLQTATPRYNFSGHDSFQCRHLWLKKGFDFVKEKRSFMDPDSVVRLGVGKNMVSSIRYWLKCFNIINNRDEITEFGNKLLSDKGYDPYLENEGSLWLLHYQLIKTGHASIYSVLFNEFRKEKLFFNRNSFVNYLKRRKETEPEIPFNANTLSDDFQVFIKMYESRADSKDIEDSFSGLLSELDLVITNGSGRDEQLQIISSERDRLPMSIFLYSILNNPNYGQSIGLNILENERDSPGSIFCMNRNGLTQKIEEAVSAYSFISYTDHAGVKELQIRSNPHPFDILDEYYES